MRTTILPFVLPLALVACRSGQWSLPSDVDELATNYADIVHAGYEDSHTAAEELGVAVQALVDDPSQGTLDAARTAWIAAREPYLQTEAFRFYLGPIDNEETGVEGLLNAWPLDEQKIDYTVDEPNAGLVNDADFELTKESLEAENESPGEKDITVGYHPIEFLLWGQDLSTDGPGDRPFTDYSDDPNAARRGEYLLLATELLVEHLEYLVQEWAPEEDNYRAEFVAEDPGVVIERIMTGMIVLSGFETGGERLAAALAARNQEEEHSCFSDNTHRDMALDAVGVRNVYQGSYERVDGSTVSGMSMREVIAMVAPDVAADLADQIDESVDATAAIEAPFDQEIDGENAAGNARVQAAIDALLAQEATMEEVFHGWKLTVPETD